MPPVPPGGPSTVNGVLYQMLYSLLTLGGFRVVGHRLEEGRLEQVTLVLEPSSGGDQQAFYPGLRVVTQLKARSTGGAWSLQEIVRGVLPDLYRAVEPARTDSQYQFVTEGERGRWTQVEELFQKFPATPPTGGCLDALDDTKEIKFGRARATDGAADSFWGEGPYTARRLLRKIVDTLRERSEVAAESHEATCRKTCALVRGFRFVGGFAHDALRAELDRWLLARIGPADRLSEKRDHLLLELGRRACSGDAHIEANAFLGSSGLADIPLTQWARLSRKTHEHLTGVLRRKRVELSEDVRPGVTDDILAKWTTRSPLLVLTGDSGSGKTWHGYRALLTAAASGDVAILVDSRGDADLDLSEAANTFWHRIVGVDDAVPLSRLRARLQRIDPANESRQVTVLVDNVSSPGEARRLLEEDWEALAVRLGITCAPHVADAVRSLLGDRGREVQVRDYTLAELQEFISRVVGIAWEEVPFDVQKTIRRPLLAELFGGLVAEDGWKPRNEYDLYEQAWKSLRARGVGAFDLDGLRRAALSVTNGCGYPWSASDLRACDLNPEAVERLVSAGWLRETTAGEFEVWHDRLLNWTIAEALAHELTHDTDCAESHLQVIAGLLREPRLASGRMLAYVPLDVMWLLSGGTGNDLFSRLVTACDVALGWRSTEILHKELLPTLGSRAVPLLLSRLRSAADLGPSYLVNNVIDGLVATGDEGLRGHAVELLSSPAAKFRRAGVRLIAKVAIAEALDRLWAIHVEGVQKPEPYLWQHSSKWTLYEDTFAALKACVQLDLSWLERTIEAVDPAAVPVHDLAYLVSAAGEEATWRRCKQALLSKVDAAHERAIASCVLTFRDRDELEWLESRVAKTEDLVGMVALRALTAMEPNRALALMDRLDDRALYLARRSCFAELHLRLPAEVIAHFAATLRTHDRPLKYALVLQGREDLIDAASFDFLLDRLTEVFSESLASGRPPDVTADCRTGLSFINDVARPELLDRLRRRRGTAFEQSLVEWAIALGPQEGQCKVPDKFDALDALARIGGDGFSRVLEVWLEKAGWGGRMHAVQMAQRRSSARTIEILTELSATGGMGDDQERAILSGYAAGALAAQGCWGPVLRQYLRVGLGGLTIVEDCCPEIDPPLDDTTLTEVLAELRSEQGPTPGSVLCVGIAARCDLLPEVRAILRNAEPGSDLAGACLLALQWLGDTDPDVVPVIARHLETNNHHATNALLVNGSPAADLELASELRRRPDFVLAVLLANDPRHHDTGVAVIRQLACDASRFRFESGLANLVTLARPEVLSAAAEWPEVFELAEEIGYSPYEPFRITGEKPAALRIVGFKQPDAALRMALARLRHPDTPDRELYVPIVATFARDKAVRTLLDTMLLDPPRRVVQAIGRELGRLDAEANVLQWLSSLTAEERLAACRIAGFLPFTDRLDAEVRARADDVDRHVSDAAVEAHERLLRRSTADELVRVATEHDLTHRWVLLDALVSVADPEGGGSAATWQQAVRPFLTPALARHLSERLKERKKKLKEELDREDRRR